MSEPQAHIRPLSKALLDRTSRLPRLFRSGKLYVMRVHACAYQTMATAGGILASAGSSRAPRGPSKRVQSLKRLYNDLMQRRCFWQMFHAAELYLYLLGITEPPFQGINHGQEQEAAHHRVSTSKLGSKLGILFHPPKTGRFASSCSCPRTVFLPWRNRSVELDDFSMQAYPEVSGVG